MPRREESEERGKLRRRLARWRAVVELHARKLRSDPREYATLHNELLQLCRTLSAASGEEHKEVYENVEKLLQPWLSTEALIQAQQDILLEVLQRCRQAERALGGWSGLEMIRRGLRPVLVTLAGAMAVGVLGWAAMRWWLPLRSLFKATRFQITMALDRLGVGERWILGGTIAVVVAMILLSRTAKS